MALPPPGLVDEVQDQLEAIYDIACPRAVEFLLHPTDAHALRAPEAPEELWVREADGEALDVGLYLSEELRARVRGGSLSEPDWVDTRLEAVAQVAEGVSHFLYFARSAELERHVSLLEMEVQGEVDKFASLVLQRWSGLTAGGARELHRTLFDAVSYRAGLGPEERWRYVEANRLARGFALRLLAHCTARRLDRILGALRYAYRLGAEAKLQHLARAA